MNETGWTWWSTKPTHQPGQLGDLLTFVVGVCDDGNITIEPNQPLEVGDGWSFELVNPHPDMACDSNGDTFAYATYVRQDVCRAIWLYASRNELRRVQLLPTRDVLAATEHVGSDCYPFILVAASPSGRKLTFQQVHQIGIYQDRAYGDHQDYLYVLEDNTKFTPSYRTAYRQGDDRYRSGSCAFSFGYRRYYRDPHF